MPRPKSGEEEKTEQRTGETEWFASAQEESGGMNEEAYDGDQAAASPPVNPGITGETYEEVQAAAASPVATQPSEAASAPPAATQPSEAAAAPPAVTQPSEAAAESTRVIRCAALAGKRIIVGKETIEVDKYGLFAVDAEQAARLLSIPGYDAG